MAVLGSVEQDSFAFVESAIRDDADGRLARMRAVMLPLRLEAIEAVLADRPEFGGYVGDEQLRNLGRDLGRELVTGRRDAALGRARAARSSSSSRAASPSRSTGWS